MLEDTLCPTAHWHSAPILKIRIGVSAAKFAILRQSGEPVPEPLEVNTLLDTGCVATVLDPAIVSALLPALEPKGTTTHYVPGGGKMECRVFDASVYIGTWSRGNIEVIESSVRAHGIDALLGRNVLQYFLFTYDPRARIFSLAI
jgi:hypothetical protein